MAFGDDDFHGAGGVGVLVVGVVEGATFEDNGDGSTEGSATSVATGDDASDGVEFTTIGDGGEVEGAGTRFVPLSGFGGGGDGDRHGECGA